MGATTAISFKTLRVASIPAIPPGFIIDLLSWQRKDVSEAVTWLLPGSYLIGQGFAL